MKGFPKGGLIGRALGLWKQVRELRIPLHAANTGYFIVLSVFPALLLLLGLLRYTPLTAEHLMELLEDLLPEAGPLERAKSYREQKALPLVRKVKGLLLSMYRTVIDLRKKLKDLQSTLRSTTRDRDYYKTHYEEEYARNSVLQKAAEDLIRVKHHDPGGAHPFRPGLEHHMGQHDAGIHGAAFRPVEGPLPALFPVIADQKSQRGMEVVRGTFLQLFQGFLTFQYIDLLGLVVAACGSQMGRLQDPPDRFFLHLLRGKSSD